MRTEMGPMATAEICRHLGVLGSCAAALDSDIQLPSRYVATHANWIRQSPPFGSLPDTRFTGRARVIDRSDMNVDVEVQLCHGDVTVGTLHARYATFDTSTFRDRFASTRDILASTRVDPQCHLPSPIKFAEIKNDHVKAFSENFSLAHCMGHFSDFPVWPAASIMSALGQTTEQLLNCSAGRAVHYEVKDSNLELATTIPTDRALEFETRVLLRNNTSQKITSRVFQGYRQVAELQSDIFIHVNK